MAQELVEYPDGLWAVDMELIETIVRSHAVATAILDHSDVVPDDSGGFLAPVLHNVEVDWPLVHQAKARAATAAWQIHTRAQQQGMRPQVRHLENLVRETRDAKDRFSAMSKTAMKQSMASIDKAVSRGELAVETAKTVRDVSAGTLGVCATVLSGGTAAGFVGAAAFGGGLDSLITLQDTGDPTAAGYTFVSKFAINLIPAGKGSDKVLMMILKSEAEVLQAGGQALVEGKTMEEAMAKALEKAAAEVLGAGAKSFITSAAGHKMLLRGAYPMTLKVTYPGSTNLERLAQTKAFTQGAADVMASAAIGKAVGAIGHAARAKPTRPVADSAVLLDERMLNQAIQGPSRSQFRTLQP